MPDLPLKGDSLSAVKYEQNIPKSDSDTIYSLYTNYLNGLHTATKYEIYDYDNPEKVYTMEGIELMKYGLTLPLPEGEKAMIIMFSEVK